MKADGYAILVTWPEYSGGQHKQEVWYAHLEDQTEAVIAVQNACGAMNDAKVEILGALNEELLLQHGLTKGDVRRANGFQHGAN